MKDPILYHTLLIPNKHTIKWFNRLITELPNLQRQMHIVEDFLVGARVGHPRTDILFFQARAFQEKQYKRDIGKISHYTLEAGVSALRVHTSRGSVVVMFHYDIDGGGVSDTPMQLLVPHALIGHPFFQTILSRQEVKRTDLMDILGVSHQYTYTHIFQTLLDSYL